MAIATTEDDRPTCPCCNGSGMHGHIPFSSPSEHDDWEGCTNCGEQGRTWFDDARPNTCRGYRTLMRRVR